MTEVDDRRREIERPLAPFATTLREMSRWRRRLILIIFDISAMMFALWAAFSVRLGILYVPEGPTVIAAALISAMLGVVALFGLGIYRIVLRFFDLTAISRILLGAATAAIIWVIAVYFLRPDIVEAGRIISVPRSIGLIYAGFLFTLLFVGRSFMAALLGRLARRGLLGDFGDRIPVAIYGANPAGISLGESVQRDPAFRLCAFIDEDQALHGQLAAGIPVHPSEALPALINEKGIEEVFLAIPSATRAERLSVVSRISELGVTIKTIPAAEDLVSGRYTVTDVRPVNVEDLLRRAPVEPLSDLIQQSVDGGSILITGAGGSIGSEICRQIARGSPRKIILFDHSEFALYTIENQVAEILADRPFGDRPEVVPIIGSIVNDRLVRDVISSENVDSIYHAAAYKHVPLLERNEVAGVQNNVLGTMVLARAALDARISRFTMISTDKAVRPRNLMGASKRLAELIVQACAARSEATRFGIVRFGNVLDSSGSVVQLFRTQILRGGPVTVTHRDMTRFFMSIPEATQLVLQASAMARNGEVFVLDMGEPVRIDELARNMIRLSGMTVRDEQNPGGDIEVAYVGTRPGEKLYEELFIGGDVVPTEHPRISKAMERSLRLEDLESVLDRLQQSIATLDSAAVRAILEDVIAPDGHPSPGDQLASSAMVQPTISK